MTGYMVLLRLVHIACGVYWAGAIFFVVTFLEPSVREVGPDGGKVMAAILRRGYLNLMPVLAVLTIVSGTLMMWEISAGFNLSWLLSPIGHTYSTGAVAAIVAATIGIFMMRPKIMRVGRLAGSMAELDEAGRGAAQQEIQKLRGGARRDGRLVGGLLAVAVITMAVARYVPAL